MSPRNNCMTYLVEIVILSMITRHFGLSILNWRRKGERSTLLGGKLLVEELDKVSGIFGRMTPSVKKVLPVRLRTPMFERQLWSRRSRLLERRLRGMRLLFRSKLYI